MKEQPAPRCPVQFDLSYPADHFTCTLPPFHDGSPHHDDIKGYTWGYDDAERDPVTRKLWDLQRAATEADARKQARRRRRRNLWGKK